MASNLQRVKEIYGNKTPAEFRAAFQALYHSHEFKILLSDEKFYKFIKMRDDFDEFDIAMPEALLIYYEKVKKIQCYQALKSIIEAITQTFGEVEITYWLFLAVDEPEIANNDCFFSFFENFQFEPENFNVETLEDGKTWAAVQQYLI